jgi:hypothetical protein
MEWLVALELDGCTALLRAYGCRPEQQLRSNLRSYHDGETNEPRAGRSFMQLAATLVRPGRIAKLSPQFDASGIEVLLDSIGEQRTIDQQVAAVEEAKEWIVFSRRDFGFGVLHFATVFEVDLELLSHGRRYVAAVDNKRAFRVMER